MFLVSNENMGLCLYIRGQIWIRSFGFLFIRSSGFGLPYQLATHPPKKWTCSTGLETGCKPVLFTLKDIMDSVIDSLFLVHEHLTLRWEFIHAIINIFSNFGILDSETISKFDTAIMIIACVFRDCNMTRLHIVLFFFFFFFFMKDDFLQRI